MISVADPSPERCRAEESLLLLRVRRDALGLALKVLSGTYRLHLNPQSTLQASSEFHHVVEEKEDTSPVRFRAFQSWEMSDPDRPRSRSSGHKQYTKEKANERTQQQQRTLKPQGHAGRDP